MAFARALGVSDLVIGLTIVAAGTSMPEVATIGQADHEIGDTEARARTAASTAGELDREQHERCVRRGRCSATPAAGSTSLACPLLDGEQCASA